MKFKLVPIFVAIAFLAALAHLTRSALPASDSGTQTKDRAGKPRVVVVAISASGGEWTKEATTAALENALLGGGRFEVIAKAQRDQIFQEQGFGNSDKVDPSKATQVGKMLAARYMVIGNCIDISPVKRSASRISGALGRLGGSRVPNVEVNFSEVSAKVQMQLVDIESGKIELSQSYEEKRSVESVTKEANERAILTEVYGKFIEEKAKDFVGRIDAGVPIEGLVVMVRGNRVAIDIGSNHSVKPGMEFEIFSEGEPIKNAAGQVISYLRTKFARIKVETVEPQLSWATILVTYDENEKADATPNPGRIKRDLAVKQVSAK